MFNRLQLSDTSVNSPNILVFQVCGSLVDGLSDFEVHQSILRISKS